MKPRKLHRLVVPIAAIPLLITAASGSLYGLLLEQGIDAFFKYRLEVGFEDRASGLVVEPIFLNQGHE